MRARVFGLAVLASVAVLTIGGGQARASSCTAGYDTTTEGGAPTIALASNIGAVCEIGQFNATLGQNGNGGEVSTGKGQNPSIYLFSWGGGDLTIQEMLGNNGINNNINVEVGTLGAVTVNSDGSLTGGTVYSQTIDFVSGGGPTKTPTDILNNVDLAAGTYVLDNYIGTCGAGQTCTDSGTATDPQYQVLFSSTVGTTPLPAAMPLFATGLGLAGMLGWRRKRKNGAATAQA